MAYAGRLKDWDKKQVLITYNLPKPDENGHSAIESVGTIESASDVGVFFKPKGKVMGSIIKAADIENIVDAPTVLRQFRQKEKKGSRLDMVRQHLLDNHGASISFINKTDEMKAKKIHDEWDHSDLSHNHLGGTP